MHCPVLIGRSAAAEQHQRGSGSGGGNLNLSPSSPSGGSSARRAISWWWTGMNLNATSPEVDAMLGFCREHRDIVSTLIMRCGVLTCWKGIH